MCLKLATASHNGNGAKPPMRVDKIGIEPRSKLRVWQSAGTKVRPSALADVRDKHPRACADVVGPITDLFRSPLRLSGRWGGRSASPALSSRECSDIGFLLGPGLIGGRLSSSTVLGHLPSFG